MIQMKVAFVLRMVNDFSGRWIRDRGFAFYIGGRKVHPVEKEDGLYVFLEPQEPETRVVIESVNYYPCSVRIEKRTLNPDEPIVEVRLYEKAGKQFSPGIGLLTGRLETKQRFPVEVYAKKSTPAGLTFKEYRNMEGEHWIWFSGYTKENLLGKTWLVDDKKNPLLILLQEKRGINEYRVEVITGEPEKIRSGTLVSRAYRSVTDRFGAYAIPVESGEETKLLEVIPLLKNKKMKKEGD